MTDRSNIIYSYKRKENKITLSTSPISTKLDELYSMQNIVEEKKIKDEDYH